MEGDDAEPTTRGQAVEDSVQALVQGVQFGVDGDADGLEGAAGRVFGLAALGRGHGAGDQVSQLHGSQDGLFLPRGHNFTGNLPGVGFLAVVPQDAGQFLAVEGVDQVRGGRALLAHAHIQRGVGMVGEAACRVVQLVAGNAEVQQSTVDRRDVKLRKDTCCLAEVCLYHLGGQALEPFGGDCHRIRVLVERDQAPGGKTFSDLGAVPCAAGGAVQVDAGGVDVQSIQAGLQKYGNVGKFHGVVLYLQVLLAITLRQYRIILSALKNPALPWRR